MIFHEFKNGMSVMEGNRCVARARPRSGGGLWLLRLYGGCWIDVMTDQVRQDYAKLTGLPSNFAADLKVVKRRDQARRLLRAIASA